MMITFARVAWLVLLLVPPAQWAFEHFVRFPVAPSRQLAIALCLVALAPIAVRQVETWRGSALALRSRVGLMLGVPPLALALLLGAVRLSDGPWGPIPGGPLRGISSEGAEPDWAQTDSRRYVAIELASRRSLETLVIHDGGHVYVGANHPELKRWPHELRRDPEIVLRVGRTLYPRRAVFVQDASQTARLLDAMNAKYGFDVSMGTGRIWFFRLDGR